MRTHHIRIGLILTLCLLGLGLNAMSQSEEVQHKEEEFSGIRSIEIENKSIDVDIRRTEGSSRIISKLHEMRELHIQQNGDELSIRVSTKTVFGVGNVHEYIEVLVNDESSISINSGSGDISVEGIDLQELMVENGSGDLEISRCRGRMTISSSSGDQHYSDVHGSLELKLSSGDLSLQGVTGVRSIETSSGDVDGSLRLEGDISIRSSSGDVNIDLENSKEELSFRLDVGSGKLRIDDIRSEDSLSIGDGPITITGVSGSGDQTYRIQ